MAEPDRMTERETQWRLRNLEEKVDGLERRSEQIIIQGEGIKSLWQAIDRLGGSIDRLREDMGKSVTRITDKQDRNNSTMIGAAVSFGLTGVLLAFTIWQVLGN
jgi:hypothetical protein